MKKFTSLFVVIALGMFLESARPQALHHTLLAESTFTDDCLICGRPSIVVPMRGTFTLVLDEVSPLFTRYRLDNIDWIAGWDTNVQYEIEGNGTYTVGGHVALTKQLVLNVTVNGKSLVFTNDGRPSERGFPDYVIDSSLTQTQQDLIAYYSMDLLTTPLREVWFSTPREITGAGAAFGPGSLLSHTGRVVKQNRELVGRLGFMPVVPHLGIDAVEIVPGGEIWFSLNDRQFSERLGEINDGDIVSAEGRIVRKYYDLVEPFLIPVARPPDYGLDALHVTGDGKILFSVRSNFFATKLGSNVTRGDLLADRGQIFRSHGQLMQRFRTASTPDYGLDAVYIWPSGEIWFSTEDSFTDLDRGSISAGDLLSDAGYIAFRQNDLTRRFAPGVQQDFGLDGLFVVSDLAEAGPPRITSASRAVRLQWEGPGRVFQLEKAVQVSGPYLPLTPITPDTEWLDGLTGNSPATGFYRLRQW